MTKSEDPSVPRGGAEPRPVVPPPWPLLVRARVLAAPALFAAASALFACHCWPLRALLIDDAYITYRYGARLAHEGTLRWNQAEPAAGLDAATRREAVRPAEGYTSFLAVAVSAGFEALRLDPLAAWKALGVLLALGGALATVVGARALCVAMAAAGQASQRSAPLWAWGVPWLAGAAWLGHPLTALHAMSGMETMLFAALLAGQAALALRIVYGARAKEDGGFGLFGAGCLLLGLARPEGVLWAAFACLAVYYSLSGSPASSAAGSPSSRRRFARSVLFWFVLPGLAYFLARWAYFGLPLPATYYAKLGGANRPSPLGRLHTYLPSHWLVWQYLRDGWLALAGATVLTLAIAAWRGARPTRRAGAVALLAAGSLLCIASFARSHLLMGYGWRFFYPFGQTFWLLAVAPAAALCCASLDGSAVQAEGLHHNGSRADRFAAGAAGLALLAALVWTGLAAARAAYGSAGGPFAAARTEQGQFALLGSNTAASSNYRPVGQALESAALRLGRPLVVFHHNMGELFYYAPHCDTVDPVGLVDPPVALHGFGNGYLFAREPDVLLLPSTRRAAITPYGYVENGFRIFDDVSRAVCADRRIAAYEYLGYCPRCLFAGGGGAVHVFVRRAACDSAPWLRDALRRGLELERDPAFAPVPIETE